MAFKGACRHEEFREKILLQKTFKTDNGRLLQRYFELRAVKSALKSQTRGEPLVEPTVSSGWVAVPRAKRPERAPWHLQIFGLASWAVKLSAIQKHNILWLSCISTAISRTFSSVSLSDVRPLADGRGAGGGGGRGTSK